MNLRDEKETEKFLNDLKYFFENINEEIKKLDSSILEKEYEREDLLHEIELGNLNAIELSMTAKRLRKTLSERRNLKEQREYVYTLKGYSDKFITKGILGDTNQLIENINNLNKARTERKYTPRILKDLKIGKWKYEKKSEEE